MMQAGPVTINQSINQSTVMQAGPVLHATSSGAAEATKKGGAGNSFRVKAEFTDRPKP